MKVEMILCDCCTREKELKTCHDKELCSDCLALSKESYDKGVEAGKDS